jgi:hypothetical protein
MPHTIFSYVTPRVSFETSFNSKEPKQEPKLVAALSDFGCFAFIPKQSFDVSIEPNQTKDQPKQFDREYILQFFTENLWFFRFFCFFRFFSRFFRFFRGCFETVCFGVSVVSLLY